MGDPPLVTISAESSTPGRWAVWAEIGLILVIFFVHAGWPVPDVNEAHYLGKAQHYWNDTWCSGDFFLESADAHLVFYWGFGWLTLWLPLPAVAWLGRILTWGLLAWAWRRLSFSLVARPLFAALSAALFVTLLERFHLAGEWVVGGVEGKGFAYVLVFLGLEAMVRNRWRRAWLLLGAASAMHVLVGGWAVLLTGFAWLTAGRDRPHLRSMLPALAGGFVLALPGLIPALALGWNVPSDVAERAYQIYVFERLPHHLALHMLPANEFVPRLVRHGALLAVFLLLWRVMRGQDIAGDDPFRPLRGFVFGAVIAVLCGLAIAFATQDHPVLAAKILRYYWFRLSDVALPLGVALAGATTLAKALSHRSTVGAWLLSAALLLCGWHLGNVAYVRHVDPRPRADYKMQDYDDWCDACDWIAEHTPEGARFLTPRMSHTFKWRTGRIEVVTYKDFPQDPQGVVEWSQRIEAVYRRRDDSELDYWQTLAEQGEERLGPLASRYDAGYLLTESDRPLHFPQLYSNGNYTIYRISPPESESDRAP